jgi:serine/threonine protein kinase
VKSPIPREFSLCSEAIVQWLAANALEVGGIQGAVPRVYDLFQYAGETRFTMDYIEGTSSVQAILESEDPERTFTHILAQTALILGYLQETIHLDHRDLKADNLWIRPTPLHYRVRLAGKVWNLTSPFQVVILDFGFACLGGADGNAVINLSDGVLPTIDPCPKEGRDLFQLLVSIWSVPAIRAKMTAPFQAMLERLLSYRDSAYDSLVQMTERSQWSYLVVSDAKFKHPPLGCLALLEALVTSAESKGFPSIQLSIE